MLYKCNISANDYRWLQYRCSMSWNESESVLYIARNYGFEASSIYTYIDFDEVEGIPYYPLFVSPTRNYVRIFISPKLGENIYDYEIVNGVLYYLGERKKRGVM